MASTVLKRLVVHILGPLIKALYKLLFLLRLGVLLAERELAAPGGSGDADEEEAAMQRLLDGSAWADFSDSVRALGTVALAAPRSKALVLQPLDKIEAHRYCSRLLRAGLEGFMEDYDPAWPVLRPLPCNVKIGADNPDNLYQFATVSGDHAYRIRGNRGTVAYLSFGVYAGNRPGQGSTKPGHLDSAQLKLEPNGDFEVILSRERQGSNWLPLTQDSSRLVVRQTFLDRPSEVAAALHLERTGQEADEKPALAATQVVAGLAGASLLMQGAAMQFTNWANDFADRLHNKLGMLPHDINMSAWADPAITFYHGYFNLKQDEVLLVQLRPPTCCYWNFQLNNYWMESLCDEGRAADGHIDGPGSSPQSGAGTLHSSIAQVGWRASTHVNKHTARAAVRSNGGVVLLVCGAAAAAAVAQVLLAVPAGGHWDEKGLGVGLIGSGSSSQMPTDCSGSSNQSPVDGSSSGSELPAVWVSTAGHTHGTMALRWVLADGITDPVCHVLGVEEVLRHLSAM